MSNELQTIEEMGLERPTARKLTLGKLLEAVKGFVKITYETEDETRITGNVPGAATPTVLLSRDEDDAFRSFVMSAGTVQVSGNRLGHKFQAKKVKAGSILALIES